MCGKSLSHAAAIFTRKINSDKTLARRAVAPPARVSSHMGIVYRLTNASTKESAMRRGLPLMIPSRPSNLDRTSIP